ncbi:MAG: DUF4232 domain-containing protein [Pseudonocardia sp.]
MTVGESEAPVRRTHALPAVLVTALVTALAALLAACGTAPGPAPAAPATSPAPASPAAPTGGAVPRCTTAELTGSLGTPDGAAGSTYRPLLLTNTGTRTCELRGFPGVSYVTGDDGQQVGPAAQEEGERGPQVELAPGEAASATVRFVNVGNFDEAACVPVPVRGLRVYPPGDTASLFVPAEGTGCSGTPPQPQLTVTTVTAAS